MKNILSLDIDLLFEGETFAKYIQHDIDAEDSWNCINLLNNTDKYDIDLNINERALKKMQDIIHRKCKNSKVYIIQEHDEILPILKAEGMDNTVWNFDFHHDITYGGDDTKCNIENWARHGYAKGYIKEYHWVCRPMSEPCEHNIMPYTKDNLEDITMKVLPMFDVIVICVSHHFTPRHQWNLLPLWLQQQCSKFHLNYFKETTKCLLPKDLFEGKDMEDYLYGEDLPNIFRVWKYKSCYVILEEDGYNLSIINKGKGFGIGVCKEVVDYVIKTYGYATFTWDCRIRNSVLIERLLKNYKELDQWTEKDNDFIVSVKFTKGDDM